MRTLILICAFSLSLCALAHAASFDCAKATSAQEKAICGSPDLSTADDQMAAAYKAWLAAAPASWAAAIRQNQAIWLHTRNTGCPASDTSTPVAQCLAQVYQERIAELKQNVTEIAGVAFVAQAIVLTARDETGDVPPGYTELTPGFGTLEATWPQAMSTTPQWTAWNHAIAAAAIASVSGDTGKSASDWNSLVQHGVDEQVTVTVDGVTGQLISASIVDFYDGHGAHPNQNTSDLYWLLDKQRELTPADIFLPNSGWDTFIEQRLDSYLHKTLDADSNGNYQTWFQPGDAQKTLQGIATNLHDWDLGPAGFSIFFQAYQVACYACTPSPLAIPWSDVKPYLQPGFVPPQ
jgi:uncharacterized protein